MIVLLGSQHSGKDKFVELVYSRDASRANQSVSSEVRDLDRAVRHQLDSFDELLDHRAVAAKLTSLSIDLGEQARLCIEASSDLLVFDTPWLCLTLPFWKRFLDDATFVILHRHPLEIAKRRFEEEQMPISMSLACWQLDMLSALHCTRGHDRIVVQYRDLCGVHRNASHTAAQFVRALVADRGFDVSSPMSPSTAPQSEWDNCGSLTLAQRELAESLAAGRFPSVDPDEPYRTLAKDPLAAWCKKTLQSPSPGLVTDQTEATEIAAQLGRARARIFHLELRERIALARVAELERAHAEARSEADDLRALLDRSGKQKAPALTPIDVAHRQELATGILRSFSKKLYREWTQEEGIPHHKISVARPRVMIGTLESGEQELAECVASVRKQTYPHILHEVFSGLGKKESIATLMRTFQASDCDLMVKLDADMVLTAPDFVERVVKAFAHSPDLQLLQMGILDFFTGGPMQGINAYRKTLDWREERQDSLFTDRVQVSSTQRLITWTSFVRDAVHSPNPSAFHSFHFGVHRGMKVLQPEAPSFQVTSAEEQLLYLEKTWAHFQNRRDRRLALACLGFELALSGRFSVSDLDYTNHALRNAFKPYETLDTNQIESAVAELRAATVTADPVEEVRRRRGPLLTAHQQPIRTIVALLPHTRVFGGVNRFFELSRHLGRLGVEMVIAKPDPGSKGTDPPRDDYPEVEVRCYSEVLGRPWDVALCGDAFGGVMLTLPLFDAKLAVVYLLNGWTRRPLNLAQITLVNPDVIVANSSYAAEQYADLAPSVVPGGVDLETFKPCPAGAPNRTERFKICTYPGRQKPIKRFEDTIAACRALHKSGIPIELHAFDQNRVALDVPFPFVFHGALDKEGVRELHWKMDVMVSAEDDGGWSNPAAEAMACGTPLVCTPAGTTDFALHENTALVVPNRNPEAIAAALRRLHQQPELARRLRSNGLEQIRGMSWREVARGLLDVLSDARSDAQARSGRNKRALGRMRSRGIV